MYVGMGFCAVGLLIGWLGGPGDIGVLTFILAVCVFFIFINSYIHCLRYKNITCSNPVMA